MSSLTYHIFNSLAGTWNFARNLSTQESVTGTACFRLIAANTLHYKESGIFTTHTQKTYQIYREYGYRYQGARDKIAVYFMQSSQLDYLFHELTFQPEPISKLSATGSHACKQDMYYAQYEFISEGMFVITYTVVGPSKNYTSKTTFEKTK